MAVTLIMSGRGERCGAVNVAVRVLYQTGLVPVDVTGNVSVFRDLPRPVTDLICPTGQGVGTLVLGCRT